MLCEIVSIVFAASAPVDKEFSISNAIANPIEAHVDGFGSTLLDSAISNARGTGIIGLDGGCRLWMAHFG